MFRNKKELEIFVESLPTFRRSKLRLEQYPTDAAVVAAAVWDAHMRGLLEAAIDLGCGTGASPWPPRQWARGACSA